MFCPTSIILGIQTLKRANSVGPGEKVHYEQLGSKLYAQSTTSIFGALCVNQLITQRGTMLEWIERLEYDAESCHKVVSSRLGFSMQQLENSLCQPSSEWVPFSNEGRLRQQKRGGLCLSQLCQRYSGTLTPHCPYGC